MTNDDHKAHMVEENGVLVRIASCSCGWIVPAHEQNSDDAFAEHVAIAQVTADWTSYDNIATAVSDLRFLLFEMRAGDHRERMLHALGPENYKAAQRYLDCIDVNLKKMGELGLRWAGTSLSLMGDAVVDRGEVKRALDEGDINTAWNLVEEATKR